MVINFLIRWVSLWASLEFRIDFYFLTLLNFLILLRTVNILFEHLSCISSEDTQRCSFLSFWFWLLFRVFLQVTLDTSELDLLVGKILSDLIELVVRYKQIQTDAAFFRRLYCFFEQRLKSQVLHCGQLGHLTLLINFVLLF